MPLTPAQKQRRYRERQRAKAAADPRIIEVALLQEAERSGARAAQIKPDTHWLIES